MGNCTSAECMADHASDYPLACPKCDRGLEIDFEARQIDSLSYKIEHNPEWIKDEDRQTCKQCMKSFGFRLRRHHCRVCGEIFCDKCSSLRIHSIVSVTPFTDTSAGEAYRSCDSCYDKILRVVCEHCRFEFCLSCKEPWHKSSQCLVRRRSAALSGVADFSGGVLVYPTNDEPSPRERRSSQSNRDSTRFRRSSSTTSTNDSFQARCPQCRYRFSDSYSAHKTNGKDGSLILCPKNRWRTDEERNACVGCERQFSFYRTRHHCRVCGDIFCGKCSDISLEGYDLDQKAQEDELKELLKTQPIRGAKITVSETTEAENLHRVCHGCLSKVMRSECPSCGFGFCMYCEGDWGVHDGRFCE